MSEQPPFPFEEGGEEWRRLLQGFFESSPIATFVIDRDHKVVVWNHALEMVNGIPAEEMLGTNRHWCGAYDRKRPTMADLLLDGALADDAETERVDRLYPAGWRASKVVAGAYESEGKFPNRAGGPDHWLYLTAAPLRDVNGRVLGAIQTLQDITERKEAEAENERYRLHLEELVKARTQELTEVNQELKKMNRRLEQAHNQMLQAEKMASIGQLAAGVAHEINNPISFVTSNLGTLESYAVGLMSLIAVYERHEDALSAHLDQIFEAKRNADLKFVRSDMLTLLKESKDGLERVRNIVQALKEFSRVDQVQWCEVDLNHEMENAISLLGARIGSGVRLERAYGEQVTAECQPLEVGQVFMILLQNAIQALDGDGVIRVASGVEGEQAWVEVADNGCGIPPANMKRIFDPFFTTQPVGAGNGLGLSIAYTIMQRHGGRIEVTSEPQRGSRFRIWLPRRQTVN